MSYCDIGRHRMIQKPLTAASLRPFILSIIAEGETYGYQIIRRVQKLTSGEILYTASTLYPVLHELENNGLLESFWREVEKAPNRKYYRLTPKGAKSLEAEKRQWLHVHRALMQLWGPVPGVSLTPA